MISIVNTKNDAKNKPSRQRTYSPEYILCAAIWLDDGKEHIHKTTDTGFTICGHRHHNCFGIMISLGIDYLEYESYSQGFLTSKNRFVDRKEAHEIAHKAGQLKPGTLYQPTKLYSEDLY